MARKAWQNRWTLLTLAVVFVVTAAMRLAILFSLPYPPGGDLAEQLYSTHVLLGTVFPSPPISPWQIPPLYYFLFFVPFTYGLPFFTGAQLLIGIMPALLVFPTYWFLRMADTKVPFAAFGAALVASSTALSLLVPWNAGVTVAGLFFAIFFFAEVLTYLREPNLKHLVLASIFFVAVGATHFLTFLFVVVALLLTVAMVLVVNLQRRTLLRPIGFLFLGCLLASLALIPTYLALLPTIVNVGPSSSGLPANLETTVIPSLWGFDSWSQTPLALVDVVVSLVAVASVVILRIRSMFSCTMLGMLASGAAIVVADPGNYTLGYYYLFIPLLFSVSVFAETLYSGFSRRIQVGGPPQEGSIVGPTFRKDRAFSARFRHRAMAKWTRVAVPAVAVVLAGSFLGFNAAYSYSAMSTTSDFYLELNSSVVQLLNWLSDHTASNAKIFLASPTLGEWVMGYANRLEYSPVGLNLEVTAASYARAYDAGLIAIGQYATGNQYLTVGENLPAWDGSPSVYLQTPRGPTLLENGNSSGFVFNVSTSGTTTSFSTETANVSGVDLSPPCVGCAAQRLTFSWPWSTITIEQTIEVIGQEVAFDWTATNGTLTSVSTQMWLPPSASFGLTDVHLPQVSDVPDLTDYFQLYGKPFSLAVLGAGGVFNQTTFASGWTHIDYFGGPQMTWSMSGLNPLTTATPFSVNSSALLRQLGVSYIVANIGDLNPGYGFSVYLRCITPGGMSGLYPQEVYAHDGAFVFSIV